MSAPVFLSYASVDRDRALAVADALEAAGVPVWIDRRGIAGGSVWIEEIAKAVRECPILLVLCSAASIVSRNVRQELQLAWDQNKPILPLLLEPVEFPDGVAYVLHGRQWIDLSGREPTEWVPEVRRALAGLETDHVSSAATARHPGPQSPANGEHTPSLPVPPNRLVGREQELAAVRSAFVDHAARLVTLTGAGGTGKTRIAIEIGRELSPHFNGGVFFVDLAPARDREVANALIAHAVGVQDHGGTPIRDVLRLRFADRPSLLILDNFEQLLADASLLSELLSDCPELRILVTSRALLHLRAEREVPIPPLSTIDSSALFVELALLANPGFTVTADQAEAIVQICERLDGLPLAIELAAARVRLLSLPALFQRLDRRLPLLTGGARDLPARQQTLGNTIAWSYDLLERAEQSLFRQLSVFSGGWTIEAAEAVCTKAAYTNADVLDTLASLVDKSLIIRLDHDAGEPRFGMLGTVREFARDRLVDEGEESEMRVRHANWSASLLDPDWMKIFGKELKESLRQIETEIGNIRAALTWLTAVGDVERALTIASRMFRYWWFVGPISEGRGWLGPAESEQPAVRPSIRVEALLAAAWLAYAQGDRTRLEEYATRCLDLSRTTGDRLHQVLALIGLGSATEMTSDFDSAEALYIQALDIARQIEFPYAICLALSQVGYCAWEKGEISRAIQYSREALALARSGEDENMVALGCYNLSRALRDAGDSLEALWLLREAIRIWSGIGRVLYLGFALVDLSGLIADFGNPKRAARLCGAAERFRELIGVPVWTLERGRFQNADVSIQQALGDEVFAAEFRVGREMQWEQAIEEALAQDGLLGDPTPG